MKEAFPPPTAALASGLSHVSGGSIDHQQPHRPEHNTPTQAPPALENGLSRENHLGSVANGFVKGVSAQTQDPLLDSDLKIEMPRTQDGLGEVQMT